ncbi:MAG TPA: response regulator transcription factor [Syntrophomonadaceae bacterium]|nr:response regulator transcription factor [Syntrophomonadaceae bacterium]
MYQLLLPKKRTDDVMKYHVFVVEDDVNINQILCTYLSNQGWEVASFTTGGEARQALSLHPHLWILDIMLPEVDGFQLIREIKADNPAVPVIFISARDADIDRIVGLEMGSDDYMSKPFMPEELVIRCRKLLQRVYEQALEPKNALHRLGDYDLDETTRQVSDAAGTIIDLTTREFDLLLMLARHQGQPLEREQILTGVWGLEYYGTDRVVDDLVRRLRKKMPALRLETLYAYGYRLVRT